MNSRALSLHAAVAALALSLALVAGCGKPKMATVTGKVTLDGTPLSKGTISFVPSDGASASAASPITEGRYSAEMPPGKKTVQISSPKVIGKRVVYQGDPNSPVVDNVAEAIPPQYNAATTLTLDVPAGKTEKDFPLKSTP